MTDERRLATPLVELRQHLSGVQAAHQLSPADCVRLASALLSSVLADSRQAGVNESTLQALDREGDDLAVGSGVAIPLKSVAAAELVQEIAREEIAEERPGTVVATPLQVLEALPSVDDDEAAFYELPPPIEDRITGDAALATLVAPPAADPAAAAGARSGAMRRHPRFVSRTEVLVAVAGQQEIEALWTCDIGSGGLFVATATPPSLGTALDITLKTPGSELHVLGRVVRVVDAATAARDGSEPGVGVEFTDLTEGRQLRIEHFLSDVSQQLKSTAAAQVVASADAWAGGVRRFLALVDAADYYGAIEAAPTATHTEVQGRIDQLQQAFERGVGQSTHDAIARSALAALQRLSKTLTDANYRLAHDFTHGHVRAEERLAECVATRQSTEPLRRTWFQIHPQKLTAAEGLARRAVMASRANDFEVACTLAVQAIDLDPLNPALRATRARWEVFAAIGRAFQTDPLDVAGITTWAAERGIDGERLRSLWAALQPERSQRAEQLARRALAAAAASNDAAALAAGCEALQHDPFNQSLRRKLARWR